MQSSRWRYLAKVISIVVALPALTAQAEWISLDSFKSTQGLTPTQEAGPNHTDKSKEDGQSTRLHIGIDALNVTRYVSPNKSANGYVSLSLTGNDAYTTEIGRPRVPVVSRYVEFTGSIANLKTKLSTQIEQKFDLTDLGRNRLMPVQPPLVKIRGAAQKARFELDKKFYARDTFFPATDFEIRKVVKVRGHKLALVDIYPVRYNPFRNVVAVKRSADFDITTPAQRPAAESSRSFQSLLAKSVLNFEASNSAIATGAKDTLLIVAGSAFRGFVPLAEYATLKRQMGFEVVVKYVDELPAQTDVALRSSIQDIYNSSTPRLAYVMLVGDVEHVPTHAGSAGGSQVTDHYYSAIDKGTYEEDLGGPDLFVSRIPVKTTDELAVVLHKLTKYQTAAFADTSWIRKAAWVATDDRWEVAEGTHNHVIDTYTRSRNYTGNFPTAGELGGDRLYAITHQAKTQNLVEMFKQGRAIINYSGHGSHSGWEGPYFHKQDIAQMDHADALPFVVGNACLTNTFSESTDSFGEEWIKAPQGAMAYWGTTNSSYWDEDDVMEKAFFDALFRDGITSIGALTNFARSAVWQNYAGAGRSDYYMEIYNLNGDPSVDLYTDEPADLDLTFDATIPLQREVLAVQVLRQGRPADRVFVSLLKEGQVVAGAFTNAAGNAEIRLEEGVVSVGDRLTVTAMAKNSRPAVGATEIISSGNAPYLTVKGFSVEGGTPATAGETANLRLVFANRGQMASGAVRLSVTSTIPQVEVLTPQLELGGISPNEIGSPAALLPLKLARSIADRTVARLNIHWEDLENNVSGDTRLLLPIAAPVLTLQTGSAVEVGGNGNGHIESGESGEFRVVLFNKGHGALAARNAIATLYSYTDGVTAGSPVFLTRDVAAGSASENLSLTFQLGDIKPGTWGNFVLRLAADDFVTDFPLYAVFGIPVNDHVATETKLPKHIADNDPTGISATLTYSGDSPLEGLDIFVKLSHSYVGDLVINLVSPSGESVMLHEKDGGSNDDLLCWYSSGGSNNKPLCTAKDAFTTLLGKSGKGQWTLNVKDTAQTDEGQLEEFAMEFRSHR